MLKGSHHLNVSQKNKIKNDMSEEGGTDKG